MRKLLIPALLGILSFFFSITQANAQTPKWTFLVYLIGSDLESGQGSGTSDLEEMMKIGSANNLDVIVSTGGANKNEPNGINWKKILRWKIEKGNMSPIPYAATDNNMSSVANLTDFISWGVKAYPAEKYVLVLWDHGGAVDGFGHDENSGKMFSIMQIKQALDNAYKKTQQPFEILGFDACLMANLEVLANYKSYARYFVASEETEPGHGWDYVPILNSIVTGKVADGAQLGKVIADGFLAQAKTEATSGITLSVIDNSKVDNIVLALEKFVNEVSNSANKSNGNYMPVAKGRSDAEEYGKSAKDPSTSSDVVDIVDFAQHVKKSDPTVAAAADNLTRSISQAVVYKVKDKTKPHSNGLTLFLPYNKLDNEEGLNKAVIDYEQISFSKTYQNFIKEFVGIALGDDQKPEIVNDAVTENNNVIEAVCTSDDYDDAYVILMSPDQKNNNIINFLGVMTPDLIDELGNGDISIKYTWDEKWIGLNGVPATVSDIYETDYEDENGNTKGLTILEIPVKINDEYVILEFSVEEDGTYELTDISPEPEEDGLFPKETITIHPGDKMTFLYEQYNIETDEESIKEGRTITINSIDDIVLGIIDLPSGQYMIGFSITDYNQNEEFFLNEDIFTIKR